MSNENLKNVIETLASVKVEVREAPKIIGVINILSKEMSESEET